MVAVHLQEVIAQASQLERGFGRNACKLSASSICLLPPFLQLHTSCLLVQLKSS